MSFLLDNYRIHAQGEPGPRASGEFVLYWMQMTQRAHDNFALDFAIEQANERNLPVLAVFRLRHDYPGASDRFHTFILEAMVELGPALASRGVQWALLDGQETPGEADGHDPWPAPLGALADRATLVVTDFFPTFIAPRQLRELRRATATPVVAVESCTIVPMGYHDKAYSTARSFRPQVEEALEYYLTRRDPPAARNRRSVELPADALAITRADIAGYVASCPIDHAVGAVTTFMGGTGAGRRRLETWTAPGLTGYSEHRGDPTVDATSRLSPWLHFGHLSPHEILLAARDAGPDAEYRKFRDELVTWRELAHNFVYYDPHHRTVEAMPPWARKELAEHEGDSREAIYGLEELEAAQTDNELWNACQRAYLRDGWMHNYLRMLWGKAVIGWTRNAASALAILEHLNDKYALDGRDPNTYGGIHWVFGKFDRPFYRRPVFGTVRCMSLNAALGKFDASRFIASMA